MEFVGALKAIAPYAGLGGIGLIVLYYLFRDFINKKIFPQLPAAKAYRLLRLFLCLTFVIAALAMLVGVVATQLNRQADARDAQMRQEAVRESNEERARKEADRRRAEEDQQRAREREAWDEHHQRQVEELNRQRADLQKNLDALNASIQSRQNEASSAEGARLAALADEANASRDQLEKQRTEELRRLEADAKRRQREEREQARREKDEEEDSRARYCCQPDGVTKVCRIGSQFNVAVDESCWCSGLYGSGLGCN